HFRNDYRLYLLILIVSSGFVFMSEARTKAWENDEILVLTDYQHSKSIRSYKAFIQYETSISDQKIAHHQTAYQACMEGLDKFPTDWELWYFRGVIQSTLNDIEDAKFAYEKSIEYKSENFLALVNYGNLLTKDEPEKAIELYKKAVLVKDDNAIIYGNLALLLHQKGKLTEAKEYYEKSLIINPNNSQVKRAYDMLRETLKENPEVEIK
ncbi:MAG: tetratricopeptide repeat protein, partial [Bacteroidales bacterium]|nr:tetratricopeptide repeat protein [Bacteroidales bacterium]